MHILLELLLFLVSHSQFLLLSLSPYVCVCMWFCLFVLFFTSIVYVAIFPEEISNDNNHCEICEKLLGSDGIL